MVLVQKWPFFQLFFLGNLRQENVFYDILERKNSFLGYKNKKFKKSKNWPFIKGVNPWFWSRRFFVLEYQKLEIFPSFGFMKIRQRKGVLIYSS